MRLLAPKVIAFLIALLASMLVGCSDEQPEDVVNLLSRAQSEHRYQAQRVYECRYAGTDALESYREKLIKDESRFLLDLIDLGGMTPATNPSGGFQEQFNIMASRFRGGTGRMVVLMRDFRVQDGRLLLENYRVSLVTLVEEFLGRRTSVVRLDPMAELQDRPSWIVRFDVETGVVLEASEFLFEGLADDGERLAARMVVESVDYDPDLSGVTFPDYDRVSRQRMSLLDIVDRVDFKIFEPLYLPEGFESAADFMITDSSSFDGEVVQSTFTDGVINIVLFQHVPLEEQPLPNPDKSGPVEIRLFRFGPLVSAEFEVDGTYIYAVSKLGQESFLTFLESLSPVPE